MGFARLTAVSALSYRTPNGSETHMRGASKRTITIALFGAVSSGALSIAAEAAAPKGPCTVSKAVDVPAKMRDGVTLLADVYRPTEPGSYPVLLMRLPYNKSTAQTYVYASPEFYASQCYIVAIQDVRGQYASQGTFRAFQNEMQDGYDSVE
jgi:predicted acyl esterase